MRQIIQDIMFRSTSLLQVAMTAAVTDILTCTAHGFKVDDRLQFTTTTTLPAGLSLLTTYYVTEVLSANTFKVSANIGGTTVDITNTGTGTHTAHLKAKPILMQDFMHMKLFLATANSANLTIKFQASDHEDVDFEAAQSPTNRWDYIDVYDLQDKSSIDGDTGISPAGTDDNRRLLINDDAAKWICADISAWTAGTLSLIATAYNNQ